MFMSLPLHAHDPAKYASSSVLSEGKWGKVKVEKSGWQFVSTATLRQLGFNDPAKVNVYGFGGRILPDLLLLSDPDDLPILPSVKTSAGIWFFGHNHVRWNFTGARNLPFEHEAQPYADESWYFISDRAHEEPQLPVAELPASATAEISTFTQMLLHENDLIHPSSTGRIYLGEDFRSTPTRNFTFDLTDKASDRFNYKVYFATYANKATTFTTSAEGGETVKSTVASGSKSGTSEEFDSDKYLNASTAIGEGMATSGKATVTVSFQSAGSVKIARLDYIELSYERNLKINNGQLYFQINPAESSRVNISGASSSLNVWDVTDPVRPKAIKLSINGSTATFVAPAGYHEYIAFIPEEAGNPVSNPTSVDNQNLHALNTPDMLIITPREYLSAANSIAEHHRSFNGFTVHVLEPEPIYNEFSSGTPDVGAFRRLLKMWYDRGQSPAPDNGETTGKIGYCLIMSRPTYDNKHIMESTRLTPYPRIPIWQSPNSFTEVNSYCTDDYIAMLDDGDGLQFSLNSQPIRVAVGRMPFKSQNEATAMVKKYLNYVTNPGTGAWHNQMMLVADNCDDNDNRFNHFDQTESFLSYIKKFDEGKRFQIEKLYLDAYEKVMTQKGPTFPTAKERFLRMWNEGVNIMTYIGHASPVEWTDEKLFEWTDVQNMTNEKLPFLYAATCNFARFDQDTPSGAETLWSNPTAGIIATICPVRSVLILRNGVMTDNIGKNLFDKNNHGVGRRIGDISIDAKNGVKDDNRLRFTIIGDPAMRLNLPSHVVKVTSIGDNNLSDPDNLPVLEARSRVEINGEIVNADGIKDSDFNGNVEITLYDAEKVIETYPHIDSKGEETTKFFNNHTTILYRGLAKVKEGAWSATVLLPFEIEDLYTPGRLSFYAYSDKGSEAHGASSDFYVYGYNEDLPDDSDGPTIHYLALNRADFESGDIVHTTPVVMAKVSDPSGINLSDVGIGHQMTLTLDGRTYFSDVNTYYSPDPDDFTAGNIAYPLPELEPGDHKLTLTVWDNANNSASADLKFTVAASKTPEIYDLRTNVNPAREDVTFTLSTDRPMAQVECRIEVFDLNGRRVWQSERKGSTDITANISVNWDLSYSEGQRVPRGIYLYRATITTPQGTSATRTRKLAVTAQ